jgi:hypothetical protein
MNTQQAGPAKTERVDATGTQRRIQAMVANGRPLAEIARLLGREPGPVSRILTQATVNEETAQAVSGLYRRIGDRIPQPQTPAERRQIAAARKLAAGVAGRPHWRGIPTRSTTRVARRSVGGRAGSPAICGAARGGPQSLRTPSSSPARRA